MAPDGFHVSRSLCEGGKSTNEDLFGVCGDYAWVLDGATGHRDQPITSGETDGQWYVEQMDEFFRAVADEHPDLPEMCRQAIEQTQNRFRSVAPQRLDRGLDLPAAAGVLVRFVRTEDGSSGIEYLVIGDCTLLVEKEHTLTRVTDNRGAPKEQEQIEAMQAQFEAGIEDPWKARERVEDVFLANKSQTNTSGGYWVLSLEPGAIEESLTGQFDSNEGLELHLMSDGFSALVDTYHIYDTWEHALEAIREDGLEAVLDEMRRVETSDTTLQTYPRTKPSDDATFLSVMPGEDR